MAEFKYRHLYGTKKWAQLRKYVWQRDSYTCQWGQCRKLLIGKAPAHDSPVAHHIKAHRGDPLLFWDASNIMAVCKQCHDGSIQKYEKTGHLKGYTQQGKPIDPDHPWNREAS